MRAWYIVAIVMVSAGLCGTACRTGGTAKVSSELAAAPGQTASPVEYYEKRERLRRALVGLSFESGFVEIDEQAARQIPGRGDEQVARRRCQQAEQLLAQNNRVAAIGAYRDAVLIAPELAESYYGLGRALLSKGKTELAIAAFRTALRISPEFADARFQLASALGMEGRWPEAIAEYRRLLEIDPQYPHAYARLAIALYYGGDNEAAKESAAAAAASGHPAPPQFLPLLAGEIPSAFIVAGGDVQVGEQVRIDVGGGTFAANETTMASTDQSPLEVVAAWNDWRDSGGYEVVRMGVGVSLDGGATWTDFTVRPPGPYQSGVEGDPMTCYDNRTGTLWVGAISFSWNGGVFVARKVPGSTTFEPSVMARESGWADKGWMAAGAAPGDPEQTRVYITYNEGALRSSDMGDTWSGPVSLGSGLGFLPRVGPNGELYVAYWNGGSGVKLKRSLNGGVSFTTHTISTRMDYWSAQDGSRFPGRFRVPPLAHIAVDPNDGTLYCVYFDTTGWVGGNRNVDLYFNKSTNQGSSWSVPVVINGDADPPGDQFFPWLEVDGSGRLHLLFYDSRHTAQSDGVVHGMFDAYYSTSDDGGATWSEYRLTPQPFDSYYDGLDRTDQFLGDYNGLAVGGNRVYPCYLSTQNWDSDIFTNVIVTSAAQLGDLNCDGVVDGFDVDPFVLALTDVDAYYAAYPDCDHMLADCNQDGAVDAFDIDPFVELLTAG